MDRTKGTRSFLGWTFDAAASHRQRLQSNHSARPAATCPDLDAVTAYEAGLSESSGPDLLASAVEQKRIIVTHDRRTMPYHAATRIRQGRTIAGVIIVSRRLPVSSVIDDLEIIVSCSSEKEWANVIKHLPL